MKHLHHRALRESEFGVEILGLDASNITIAQRSELRAFVNKHRLVLFREQSSPPFNLESLAAVLGSPPMPVSMRHLREFAEFELSDNERGIKAKVDDVQVRWGTFGAQLVAPEVKFLDSTGKVFHSELDVRLDASTESIGRSVILKSQQNSALPPKDDEWHSDMSFLPKPPTYTVLYAREVPSTGRGATQFLDMSRAFDRLPRSLQLAALEKSAVHSATSTLVAASRTRVVPVVLPDVTHPLVLTQPHIGSHLFISPLYLKSITGDGQLQWCAPLLGEAVNHAYAYTHYWRPDDIVVWNNAAVIHRGLKDYGPTERREVHRSVACID